MRLFVALTPPDELSREIHQAAGPLRETELSVRWVEPRKYHVTMKFIGEVDEGRRDEMEGCLRRVMANYRRPFDVTLDGVGAFPALERPRVIWMGVEPTPALRSLKHDLEEAYATLGIERERRDFHPHVTLGRVSGNASADGAAELEAAARGVDFRAEFRAPALELVRSRLRPEGAEYTVEARVSVGGGEERAAGDPG